MESEENNINGAGADTLLIAALNKRISILVETGEALKTGIQIMLDARYRYDQTYVLQEPMIRSGFAGLIAEWDKANGK